MQLPATAQFPLCKDCRFFVSDTGDCGHDTALLLDYVKGNHSRYRAQTHRVYRGARDCGPDGKFFEPATQPVAVETPADVVEVVRFNGGEAA